MTLSKYLAEKNSSQTVLHLINKLKLYWENDEEFIIGVLNDLKTDEERELVIDYIDNGKDVTYENIILLSLELCNMRKYKI